MAKVNYNSETREQVIKLFLKPIDVTALDDMRLSNIMKLTGCLQDGNKIIVLNKESNGDLG